MAKELDPNFVIMAQCYTAEGGQRRLRGSPHPHAADEEVGGVDWVQLDGAEVG